MPLGLGRVRAVVALYVALSVLLAGITAHALHKISNAQDGVRYDVASEDTQTAKYMVLMVLDGARPDYLTTTALPHLDALRKQGTTFTTAMSGILESETPSGHTTIATGSRGNQNGIFGFDWANDNDRYSLFNPAQMGNVLKLIQDSGAPTIAGLYKAAHPDAQVVALSGHKYYAAAPMGGPDADAILYYQGDSQGRYVPVSVPGHSPPAGVLNAPGVIAPSTHLKDGVEDHLATTLALSAFNKMQPRILMINYPEFDWPLGHVDGGDLDQEALTADMQGFDQDLGRLEQAYRQAGILDQTLFIVTADHGMMPITRFIPSSVVTDAIAHAGTTSPDIASNSADYVWLADPTKAQTVAQNVLAAHDPGIASAYYLSNDGGHAHYEAAAGSNVTPDEDAANQYLLSALLNGREPAVVVFGNEGASFSDPKSNWKADHGGNTWQSQHIPLVLSGPGVRQGAVATSPAQLEDVAPTALALMGVEPTGMEGRVLTDALTQPTPSSRDARALELNEIDPVVSALRAEEGQGQGQA